jgi:hypothetical protein
MATSKKDSEDKAATYDQNKGCPLCGIMIPVDFPGRDKVYGALAYPAMLYHYSTVHPGAEPLADPGPDARQIAAEKAEQAAGG